MNKDVWKVNTIPGNEVPFEKLCEANGIYYKPYPKPIKDTYRVECPKEKMVFVLRYIKSYEVMPVVSLS